jgi:PadR family transcriptional regulator, regulatory protein PadR
MNLDRELLKGSISLLLLNLLSRGPMYGYEIIQEAARRSSNVFEFKEGTLYPALHQLERKGYVTAEWRTGDNGRERRYYSLTAEGREAAEGCEEQWRMFTGAINAVLGSK